MSTEKIPIDTLNIIDVLPGGITVYDSSDTAKRLSKPTQISDLKVQNIQTVSKTELEDTGISIVPDSDGKFKIQFRYPKKQQSLLSFTGTLPAYTYIFTNPSEDPRNHPRELINEVFRTTADIEFQAEEPTHISVLNIESGTTQEISRLGHFISLIGQQSTVSQFPPDDLRLFLPPVHIPSQHLGDCAADTVQTALFFADGFQEVFAELANTLYKKYIRTEPLVLFGVDNPTLVEEVRKAFQLSASLSQQADDTVKVLTSMIRRFILVRLLDFGTSKQIASLQIPPTSCLLPGAVTRMGVVKGRRKSINLLSGATIARKFSRIFEPSSMIGPDLKLKETEIHLKMEHDFFCLLFQLTKQSSLYSFIFDRFKPIPVETSKIRAILYPLMLTAKNTSGTSLEQGGHSISLFRFQETWYLQDDNIGIAKPLPLFDIEHYLQHKSEFFISSFSLLKNKVDLIEQGFFQEKEFRAGLPQGYIYYGYRYTHSSGIAKERILYKDRLDYHGRFDSGPTSLYLCVGPIDEAQMKKALYRCGSQDQPVPVAKASFKVKTLPPELLVQMNLPDSAVEQTKRSGVSLTAVRRNIQANLNSFNITRKVNVAAKNKNTRKIHSYTNTKILNQFSGFE